MPKYVNLNRHRAYVDNPDTGLVRLSQREEVEADGAFADNLEATPGVYKVGSKEAKERLKELDAQDENLESFGPEAFPVIGEASGPSEAELAGEQGGTVTTDDLPSDKPAPKKSSAKRASAKKD